MRDTRRSIVTLCVGPAYQRLAQVTHPSIRAYAERIRADFLVVSSCQRGDVPIGYEKLNMGRLLNAYDRILFLDTDLIVSSDCPDLFDLVSPGRFGAFNEGEFVDRRPILREGSQQFGIKIADPAAWERRYYNTGVMVFDTAHRSIFEWPPVCHDNYFEQTYLNLQIGRCLDVAQFVDLQPAFNRMAFMDGVAGDSRTNSYIIHYAGTSTGSGWCDLLTPDRTLEDLVMADLASWRQAGRLSDC